jgi:hypothetical protein
MIALLAMVLLLLLLVCWTTDKGPGLKAYPQCVTAAARDSLMYINFHMLTILPITSHSVITRD